VDDVAFAPDWRWMLGREDSAWYPTMKLFRQERFGIGVELVIGLGIRWLDLRVRTKNK
jgi:hypothetical protein